MSGNLVTLQSIEQSLSLLIIMKTLIYIILAFILLGCDSGKLSPELHDICTNIDAEIADWHTHIAKRQKRIDSLKVLLYNAGISETKKYDLCHKIINEYSSFQNDSALFYCKMLGIIAPYTKKDHLIDLSIIVTARQAVKSGNYEAAMSYLNEVDTASANDSIMLEYWRVRHFALMEMASYCYIWEKRLDYLDQEAECRMHLLHILSSGSAEWLMYKAYDELLHDNYLEAKKYSDLCLEKAPRYGAIYRDASFHRRFICESLNDADCAFYWQAECAISELRLGMTDQIGVWSLASKIGDKDLDKSYDYVRFAWDAISLYGVTSRSWQVAPVLSTIEHKYQAENEKLNQIIISIIIVLFIALVLLVVAYVIAASQRKRLAIAKRQIQQSNDLLRHSNDSLMLSNSQLADTNRAKEKYIVQLLAYNSDFISAKDEERRTQSKLLRNGKMQELAKVLNSADKSGKELNNLLYRFDELFLELYPDFINQFNSLLKEECRIHPSKAGHLNTPLRIFALMRLGISRIPDISRILHCSAQTIYNYRNNARNAYLYDRNDFEKTVCLIGIPDLVEKKEEQN